MGEDGLDYGMTKDHLKRIRELEKEKKDNIIITLIEASFQRLPKTWEASFKL
jgi:hypothetical protein